jgi:alkaline phosphatase D
VFDEGACAELEDPDRTMLGFDQERWLARELSESRQRWNVVAQQTLVTPLDIDVGSPGTQLWNDPWTGYPAARRRLVDTLATAPNPVVVGGDLHGTYVSDLCRDDGSAVGTEFCGTSITTGGMTAPEQSEGTLAGNPHLTYVNGHERGYVAFELTPERMIARVRSCDVSTREGGVWTAAEFEVEDGVPTVVRR